MAKLTDAGYRMIGEFIEHKAWVDGYRPVAGMGYNPRHHYASPEGRVFMTLAPGDGAAAATVRKLVRDGFAEGTFNWGSQARWMIPTESGLAAYWERRMQEKHEADLHESFG